MTILLPILAVAVAAFCVWLTVRIINQRERWAILRAALNETFGGYDPAVQNCSREGEVPGGRGSTRAANVHSNVSNRPVGKRFTLRSAGFRRLTAFEDADPHWRRNAIHWAHGPLAKIKILFNGEVFGNWPPIGGSGGTSPSRRCTSPFRKVWLRSWNGSH